MGEVVTPAAWPADPWTVSSVGGAPASCDASVEDGLVAASDSLMGMCGVEESYERVQRQDADERHEFRNDHEGPRARVAKVRDDHRNVEELVKDGDVSDRSEVQGIADGAEEDELGLGHGLGVAYCRVQEQRRAVATTEILRAGSRRRQSVAATGGRPAEWIGASELGRARGAPWERGWRVTGARPQRPTRSRR